MAGRSVASMDAATWIDAACGRLAGNSASPRLDAELIYCHATGLSRAGLLAHPEHHANPRQATELEQLLDRRIDGVPVAYLTGHKEFYSLSLAVNPQVLVPRPETELLVDLALDFVPTTASWQIFDIGTGSGAIALAIAAQRPRCRIIATDLSQAALDVARANAASADLSNIEFRQGDCLDPVTGLRADLVVSNPPYVATRDARLDSDELRHEPRGALAGGSDGLSVIRRIVAAVPGALRPGGRLMLEHGADQAAAVAALLADAALVDIRRYRDYAGLDRVSAGSVPG